MTQPSEKGKAVVKQFETLRSIRAPLDREYRECYEYTYSSLGGGFQNQTLDGFSNAQQSAAQNARKLDTTGTDAVRLLASSVLSSLTPPNNRWFDLGVSGVDDSRLNQAEKQWLRDSSEIVHEMIHASNYDSVSMDFVLHQMIAGMAGLYVELKNGKFRFEVWPLNHLYVAETLNDGYIDTVYRQCAYTAASAVNEFGLNNVPEKIRRAYEQNPHGTDTHRFVVAIRPRIKLGKQSSGKKSRNLPWESLWVSECGTIVRESGFHEMPVIVPRWLKIPDTDYARGPVYDALPDMKSLNKVMESMFINMEMHISGVFKFREHSAVNPNTIRFGPRRFIPVQEMDDIQELRTGGDINFALNQVEQLKMAVRKMLLADQLGPTEKAILTATEVDTRNAQVRQVLGPIFARMQSEYLTRLIDRCFGLAERGTENGSLLPPKPITFSELPSGYSINYRSPLARAQKLSEIRQVDEFVNRMTTIAQVKPDVLDFVNYDEVVMKVADMLGVDASLVLDKSEVERTRYKRQKQAANEQAMAQQAAMQQAAAAAMKDADPIL